MHFSQKDHHWGFEEQSHQKDTKSRHLAWDIRNLQQTTHIQSIRKLTATILEVLHRFKQQVQEYLDLLWLGPCQEPQNNGHAGAWRRFPLSFTPSLILHSPIQNPKMSKEHYFVCTLTLKHNTTCFVFLKRVV